MGCKSQNFVQLISLAAIHPIGFDPYFLHDFLLDILCQALFLKGNVYKSRLLAMIVRRLNLIVIYFELS